MYVPAHFSDRDRRVAAQTANGYPFGLLVTCGEPYARATHAPMIATGWDSELRVYGHLARANPQSGAIANGAAATAIFQGPHAYISASWYESPQNNVPTWNYSAVHLSGTLRKYDAREVLAMLERTFEEGRPAPWRVEDADPAYIARQLDGIVAFELRVERFESAAKLGQNRSPADRQRVVAELERSPYEIERACAELMKQTT